MPSQSNFDAQHAANNTGYSARIAKAYYSAITKSMNLKSELSLDKNSNLFLRNNPKVNKSIDEIIDQLYGDVLGVTVEGITSEWDLAVEKNNELVKTIYGDQLNDIPKELRNQYLSNNHDALKAFISRKDSKGLGLSDKVWNNTSQFKTELELALETGIGSGQAASTMARNMKQYLQNPDALFRRVRNANGELRLSQAAKVYHPGQGVYRSSYKNALRLARNEINFSYEQSQQEKRKQQPFIVGVEIRVSPQHRTEDDKGGISCQSLQGKYPKDFDFSSKWHVNCKCMSLNILKTAEELDADIDLILSGGAPTSNSVNEVEVMPENYKQYLTTNSDKWKNWTNQPRFIASNNNLMQRQPAPKVEPAPVEIAPKKETKKVPKPKKETKKEINTEVEPIKKIDSEDYPQLKGKEATEFYAKENIRVTKTLNPAEQKVLQDYNKGTTNIKRKYVSDEIDNYIAKSGEGYNFRERPIMEAKIKALDAVIEKGAPKQNITLHGNIDGDFAQQLMNKQVGEVYTNYGYTRGKLTPTSGGSGIKIEMLVNKNAKVANLGNKEQEYLLGRNSNFVVRSVNKETNTLVVEVFDEVPPKPGGGFRFQSAEKLTAELKTLYPGCDINISKSMDKYYHNVLGDFDMPTLVKEINSTFTDVGIPKVGTITLNGSANGVNFTVGGNVKKSEYLIRRAFTLDSNNERQVAHSLFTISDDLQGKDLSKKVFKSLYKQYKTAKVQKIKVHANIDVGGYAWAKYGFSQTMEEAQDFISSRFKGLQKTKALDIFTTYKRSNSGKTHFPMNLLAEHPDLKKSLLGSDWYGELLLKDPLQRNYFEKYMGFTD